MIPPGYDDNRFFPVSAPSRQAIRQRLGFEGRVVLAIGRLAQNKGYDLLIEAFTLVTQRIPDAVLFLAVGGTQLNPKEQKLLDELHALVAERGLTDKVKFGGFVADADLADYYRAADVFVLSSRYEPFGMTAIEAMACGTPTVITTHGDATAPSPMATTPSTPMRLTAKTSAFPSSMCSSTGGSGCGCPGWARTRPAACSPGPASRSSSSAWSRIGPPPSLTLPTPNGTSRGMTATNP